MASKLSLLRHYLTAISLLFSYLSFSISALANELPEGLLFTVKGSNTVGAELMPRWAEGYLKAKGLVNITRIQKTQENEFRVQGFLPNSLNLPPRFIDIAAHGSTTAFEGLTDKTADIGMASRRIKSQEIEALADLGSMDNFHAEKVVAIDGLAIIIHPSNPIKALTATQVAQIFSGEVDDWQQVGGNKGKILRFARDENSGTWDTFKNLVLGNAKLAANTARFESNTDLSRQVSNQITGIGFVGLAAVNSAKALAIYDQGTDPLLPSASSVATEDYLLSRRLYLYLSPKTDNAITEDFVQFAQSQTGQSIVEAVGYISQNPRFVPEDLISSGNPEYAALLEGANRLSVNIRFNAGSAELDNKARQDIQRLTLLMREPENQHRQLQLVGFGDPKQAPSRAIVLSKLRATAVKMALYNEGISTAPVAGFGALMPVDASKKERNQRVEVWLK